MNISVIGSGSWGCAISVLLAKSGHDISLWSYFKEESDALGVDREHKAFLPGIRFPDNIYCTSDMEKALCNSELVVMVTPSRAVFETAKNMAPHIKEGQIIVSASKGLDQTTLKRLSLVIEENIPKATVAVISGPSHAEEVSQGLPTTNVVASRDIKTAEYIQDIFMCPSFRVYTSTDVCGVEYGGALKNIIALGAGISDGLGFGDNTKAALMTRGIAEIARLGVALGANITTFSGLSGIGDLIVTCTSMHSRNRRAGILIGQGKTAKEATKEVRMVVEGIDTTAAAYKLAMKTQTEMPITEQLYKVLFESVSPRQGVTELMTRGKRHETDYGII